MDYSKLPYIHIICNKNPGYKGKQNPAVLYEAKKCKIKEIYSIGGPSSIAAVAYGTKKIRSESAVVLAQGKARLLVEELKDKNQDQV